MRSDVCGAVASRSYANARADSASACTLTSPLLRSRFLLVLLHLLPRDTHPLSFALYAHSPPTPPASTVSPALTPVSSCHPLFPLPFSISFRPNGSHRPSATSALPGTRHQVLYIYTISLLSCFSLRTMWTCATFSSFPPFTSFSIYTPSDYVALTLRSWIPSENYLRPLAPVFLIVLSSRLRYQVLSPCLRVPTASFRFVEIYSYPLFLSCFILSRSTSALKLLSICQRVYRFVSPSRYLLAILSFIILHFNVLINL